MALSRRDLAAMWMAVLVTCSVLTVHVKAGIVRPHRGSGEVEGRILKLVETAPLVLPYHNGQVLGSSGIPVYITWYGRFSKAQKTTITDFLASFAPTKVQQSGQGSPSVSSWWKITGDYKDLKGQGVAPALKLAGQVSDRRSSLGLNLKMVDIESLVTRSLRLFPANPNAIYLVLTADNVYVEGFCASACGSHAYVAASKATQEHPLPYAWVGNAGGQCHGQCAWPFAAPSFPGAPEQTPLKAPNGDVGVDGMIINIATMLAGTATNPFGNAYFQGDASFPLEAATACQGAFGAGSYPGYPGQLQTDTAGASFNSYGSSSTKSRGGMASFWMRAKGTLQERQPHTIALPND